MADRSRRGHAWNSGHSMRVRSGNWGILLFASNDGGVDRISHQSGSWSITDRPAVLRYWTLIGICKGMRCRDRQGWLNRIITCFEPCLVGDAKAMQEMILFACVYNMNMIAWNQLSANKRLHEIDVNLHMLLCAYWFENMCWQNLCI